MHCDVFKIQDSVAIVEKLNYALNFVFFSLFKIFVCIVWFWLNWNNSGEKTGIIVFYYIFLMLIYRFP